MTLMILPRSDSAALHTRRHQIAIVLGYGDLLRQEASDDSPLRHDLTEMHKVATAPMTILRTADEDVC